MSRIEKITRTKMKFQATIIGLWKCLLKQGSGADAVPGADAGEVAVRFGEGQHSQEEDHHADAQGAALVGGGGVHCRPQDGDKACYYCCHRHLWLLLGI